MLGAQHQRCQRRVEQLIDRRHPDLPRRRRAQSRWRPSASYDRPAIQVGSVVEAPPGRCCTFAAAPSTAPRRFVGRTCHSAPAEYTSTWRSIANARMLNLAGWLPLPPPRPPPPPPPPPPVPPAAGTSRISPLESNDSRLWLTASRSPPNRSRSSLASALPPVITSPLARLERARTPADRPSTYTCHRRSARGPRSAVVNTQARRLNRCEGTETTDTWPAARRYSSTRSNRGVCAKMSAGSLMTLPGTP